jgi:hypothetical protein
MNIQEIYGDKKEIIEKAMSKAMGKIFDSIEEDEEYTLSTDENIELCEELMSLWLKR